MKKTATRILLALLALLMCVSSFVGCKKDTEEAGGEAEETVAVETGFDALPDDLDYNEDEVRILHWEDANKPEFTVENTETLINEAIYKRNAEVEDRLNVKFKFIPTEGRTTAAYVSTVRADFTGGLNQYDILASYTQTIATTTNQSFTQNLTDLDYLNLEQPYWPESLTSSAKIGKKLYFVSGDISTNALYAMYAMFFNKETIEDNQLDDPYELVKNNQWTIDKMFEMANTIYEDYLPDGRDMNDSYGIVMPRLSIDAFFYGSGIITTENEGGKLVASDTYFSEKAQNLAQKLVANFFGGTGCYMNGAGGDSVSDRYDYNTPSVAFSEGRVLFAPYTPLQAEDSFRGTEVVYGVVPIPKYDTDQENYMTAVGNMFTLYSVYSGVTDEVRIQEMGAVLEALGSAAYRITTPAVFETSLKLRYAHDDVTSQMYDIIKATLVFDVGRFFGEAWNETTQKPFRNMIAAGSADWMSTTQGFKDELNEYVKRLNSKLK